MKTCFLYGFLLAVAGSILILVLYFLGFHSDPTKLAAGNWIGGVLGLGIGISFTVLGVKARRSEVPENVEFGYGRALGAGVLISLFASILSTIFNYVYAAFINPGLTEIRIQDAMGKLEAKGITGIQAENMEKGMRFMSSPGILALSNLIGGFIFGVILSLIIAAFLKRPPPGSTSVQVGTSSPHI
jgi:hypothetical protein